MNTMIFMSRCLFILVILSALSGLAAQVPDWQWVSRAGGVSDDYGNSIATDAYGNSYLTGAFQGTATFGDNELVSSGNDDIYVAKIDSNGNWIWAVSGGSAGIDSGSKVDIDATGNIYI